ncbi:MAG: ATP-binding protein [Desulfovibrionaceae bacterium]|nr:ATP-binding protein [Desulfovibrionaceae bacterium]MBF0513667.1 ATP-binding protein [Desulfovibrionaceae bacterium]
MRKQFAITDNVKRFVAAVNAVVDAQPGIDRFVLVYGPVGLGKTETALWWKNTQSPQSAFVRIKKAMSVRWLLEEIVAELGEIPLRRTSDLFHQAVEALVGTDRALILDEVDYVADKTTLIETLRDLGDMTGSPIVLLGMPWAEEKLKKYTALKRRISQLARFEGLTRKDVAAVLAQICEVALDDSAVEAIVAANKITTVAQLYRWAAMAERIARTRKLEIVTGADLAA